MSCRSRITCVWPAEPLYMYCILNPVVCCNHQPSFLFFGDSSCFGLVLWILFLLQRCSWCWWSRWSWWHDSAGMATLSHICLVILGSWSLTSHASHLFVNLVFLLSPLPCFFYLICFSKVRRSHACNGLQRVKSFVWHFICRVTVEFWTWQFANRVKFLAANMISLSPLFSNFKVNDYNLEDMGNDEAVRVLREVVQKPGWVLELDRSVTLHLPFLVQYT